MEISSFVWVRHFERMECIGMFWNIAVGAPSPTTRSQPQRQNHHWTLQFDYLNCTSRKKRELPSRKMGHWRRGQATFGFLPCNVVAVRLIKPMCSSKIVIATAGLRILNFSCQVSRLLSLTARTDFPPFLFLNSANSFDDWNLFGKVEEGGGSDASRIVVL